MEGSSLYIIFVHEVRYYIQYVENRTTCQWASVTDYLRCKWWLRAAFSPQPPFVKLAESAEG